LVSESCYVCLLFIQFQFCYTDKQTDVYSTQQTFSNIIVPWLRHTKTVYTLCIGLCLSPMDNNYRANSVIKIMNENSVRKHSINEFKLVKVW